MNARTIRHQAGKVVVRVDGVALYIGTDVGARRFYEAAVARYGSESVRVEKSR